MYYKIISSENKVVDLIEQFIYVKYSPYIDKMVLTIFDDAQGILSSSGDFIWHLRGLYNIPVPGYDTVEAVQISKEEYQQLKALNGKTPEEIIDEYTLLLLQGGLL